MSPQYSDEFPLLPAHGLYAADILGDGNCLFNALSDQMFGHQNQHHMIRAKTIDYMRENADYYKQFVTCYAGGGVRRNPKRKTAGGYSNTSHASGPSIDEIDRVFERHLQSMARGGTWGDNMEIVAFSSAFDVNVKIYQRDNAYMVAASGGEDGKTVCHIAYHDWEHYSSIRNLEGPHEGLPRVKTTIPSFEQLQQSHMRLQSATSIPEYKIKLVASSLPFLVDEQTILRTLEECHGNVNNVVDRLLDADEQRSTSSQQSSSIDRDFDSSDENSKGPNKKQDRRLSRASKTALKLKHDRQMKQIASKLDTVGDSLDSLIHATSGSPAPIQRKRHSIVIDSDDEDSSFEPLKDGYTSSESEYSASISAPQPPPVSTVTGIKLKLAPSAANKTLQKAAAPQKRLVSARDLKTIKKQAQKTAAKERRRAASASPSVSQQNSGAQSSQSRDLSVPLPNKAHAIYSQPQKGSVASSSQSQNSSVSHSSRLPLNSQSAKSSFNPSSRANSPHATVATQMIGSSHPTMANGMKTLYI